MALVHDAVSRNCLEKHDSWTDWDWVSSATPPRRYSPREQYCSRRDRKESLSELYPVLKNGYRPRYANIYLILMNCLRVFHACYFGAMLVLPKSFNSHIVSCIFVLFLRIIWYSDSDNHHHHALCDQTWQTRQGVIFIRPLFYLIM